MRLQIRGFSTITEVAGGALLLQALVLCLVGESAPLASLIFLAALGLVWLSRSGSKFGTSLRRHLPVAGLGGLAMLAGAFPDLARNRPAGGPAVWSFVLMMAVCWWACQANAGRLRGSRTRVAGCRLAATVGMLVGMAAAHAGLAATAEIAPIESIRSPGIDEGTRFALSHAAMVIGMAVGSAGGLALPRWLIARAD